MKCSHTAILLTIIFGPLSFSCSTMEKVGKWERFEIVLQGEFEGNPFTEVSLGAVFTSPEGGIFRADGFHDGDGEGGIEGDVFKIRFAPSQVGSWTYRVESSLPSLDGLAGSFECVRSEDPGPLVWDPEAPCYLKWADGGWYFESGADDPEAFLASGFASTEERLESIDYLAEVGVNSLYMGMVNAGPGDGGPNEKVTPWTGGFDSPDFDTICLDFMNRAETVFDHMLTRGIVIHLVFYLDDCGGVSDAISPEQEEMLFRYVVARFGAYPNLVWNLAEEFEEAFTLDWCESRAGWLKKYDPFPNPVTVHQLTNDIFRPAGSPNFDLTAIQYNANGDSLNRMVGKVRRQTAEAGRPIPVLVTEWTPIAPEDTLRSRKGIWAIATGGGTYQIFNNIAGQRPVLDFSPWEDHWKYAGILKGIVESLPFQRMGPSNGLVSDGYCLAEAGSNYLIYQPEPGTFTVDLTSAEGSFHTYRIDPRTGAEKEMDRLAGGSSHRIVTPTKGDWAYLITNQAR